MALHLDLTGLFSPSDGEGLTREAFLQALPAAEQARADHWAAKPAWQELPGQHRHLENCQARARQVRESHPLEAFAVLGIGGSGLGASALLHALSPVYQEWRPQKGDPKCFVLDSVDPDWLGEWLESVPLDKLHVNVVSKSGGTIETSAQFLLVYDAVRKAVGSDEEARKRFTLTTDNKAGHFRKLADEVGFETLEVPDGVGGRFSVLSPVGLFPAVMAGMDAQSLLEGAARVDANLAQASAEEDPALAYALAHVLWTRRGHNVHVHFPYSHRLRLLADWYQQLWAESLGKRLAKDGSVVHTGATPVKAVGPTDQHSQVQLYVEGPNDKVFTMLKLRRFGRRLEVPPPFAESAAFQPLLGRTLDELMEAERQGTEVALQQAGRPLCVLELCQLDAFHVGQYFMFMEVATAYAGGLMGIDPYDQPGVEAGKKAALALMNCPGFENLAGKIREQLQSQSRITLSC